MQTSAYSFKVYLRIVDAKFFSYLGLVHAPSFREFHCVKFLLLLLVRLLLFLLLLFVSSAAAACPILQTQT